MPPTTASSCTSCARFGATAPSKRCTAACSSPGPGHSPSPCGCPTQAPPAPAPALWISRSGSLAAGSASTAPAGPTPPPSPSGTPPTKSTAPTANAPNRGKPPTTRYLSSGCPGPTARPSLPAPDFPCPAQRLLLLSLPPVWHLGEDAPQRTGLVRPGRGPRTACSTTAAPACAAQPAATLRWSTSSTATTPPAMTPWCWRPKPATTGPSNPGRHLCDAADIGGTAISQRPFGIL